MNKCIDEIKIFELTEGEIFGGEEKELFDHIKECDKCRKIYESYAGIKSGVQSFYNEIELKEARDPEAKLNNTANGRKRETYFKYVVLAASIILGFFIIENISKNDSSLDLISNENEVLKFESSISEWDMDVYTMSNKIELIRNQLNESILTNEKAENENSN